VAVQQKSSHEHIREKTLQELSSLRENCALLLVGYGVAAGDSIGLVVASGLAAVVVSAGVVATVASGDPAGLAAGAVVSVFCSQAASSAAPARMQMYLFIIVVERAIFG
jgi:hypothetical protein